MNWYQSLPPAEVQVPCGAGAHAVRWEARSARDPSAPGRGSRERPRRTRRGQAPLRRGRADVGQARRRPRRADGGAAFALRQGHVRLGRRRGAPGDPPRAAARPDERRGVARTGPARPSADRDAGIARARAGLPVPAGRVRGCRLVRERRPPCRTAAGTRGGAHRATGTGCRGVAGRRPGLGDSGPAGARRGRHPGHIWAAERLQGCEQRCPSAGLPGSGSGHAASRSWMVTSSWPSSSQGGRTPGSARSANQGQTRSNSTWQPRTTRPSRAGRSQPDPAPRGGRGFAAVEIKNIYDCPLPGRGQ
jgi:hypothetical protein